MIDTTDALNVMRVMAAAFHFDEDSTALWVSKLTGLADQEAAWKAVEAMTDAATDRFTPAWGAFRAVYDRWAQRHEEREAERRLALGDGSDLSRRGFVHPYRGRQIAAEAYSREYGRPSPTDIFSLPDPDVVPVAREGDAEVVERVCRAGNEYATGWMGHYVDVYKALDRDHLRARAACRALEQGRKLEHRNNGVLVWLRQP